MRRNYAGNDGGLLVRGKKIHLHSLMARYSFEQYVARNRGKGYYLLSRAEYYKKYGRDMSAAQSGWTKRKRRNSNGPPAKRFKKGYDRVGGNWGRYRTSGGELKWFDLDLDVAALTAAAQFIPADGNLLIITQGVGESQRVGRKIVIRKIQFRYNLNLFAGISQANHDDVRVILYKDKQTNGAIATATTILQTDNYQSFRNMENVGRYTVLMDRMHALNHTAAGGNGTAIETCTNTKNYKFFKECNIPVEYNAATGDIAEIRSNNLGIMVLCATGAVVKLEGVIRFRYTD